MCRYTRPKTPDEIRDMIDDKIETELAKREHETLSEEGNRKAFYEGAEAGRVRVKYPAPYKIAK